MIDDARYAFLLSENDPPAKRAIIAAALDLFAERGIDGVSVRDIAARTGFTNPALFRHFKTKDELAYWLFEACYGALVARLEDRSNGDDLGALMTRSLTVIEQTPECVHYVFENARRFFRQLPDAMRSRSLLGAVRRAIEAEKRAGRVRADVSEGLAAALVIGVLTQVVRMAFFNELPRPPAQLADDLTALLQRGIGG